VDAPRRNYRDPNHKPELVSALTPFTALKGFRPLDEVARNLEPVARPEFAPELGRLAREQTPLALRAALRSPHDAGPRGAGAGSQARDGRGRPATQDRSRLGVGRTAHDPLPGRRVRAEPSLSQPRDARARGSTLPSAGELHAYLEGTALEVMANSDNVLRGGLTPKHVDVPELLATLAFEGHGPEVLQPADAGPGERVYRTPAREFELGLLEVAAGRPFTPSPGRGVEILLGLAGETSLVAGGETTPLGQGRAVVVPAAWTRTQSRATAASAAPASRPRASSLPSPSPRPGTRPPSHPSLRVDLPGVYLPCLSISWPSRPGSARPPSWSRPSPRGAAVRR